MNLLSVLNECDEQGAESADAFVNLKERIRSKWCEG